MVTIKTSELAEIIVNQFEISRLKAEAIDPVLGRYRFNIGTTAPNLIAIQVPEVVQIDNYTASIFSIIDSIIDESGYEVTEPIEIHINGPDQEHIGGCTLNPLSKQHVTSI